jgi:DNA-binding SARP family transcriptional activator
MRAVTIDTASCLTVRFFGPFAARLNGDPLPRPHSRKSQWLLALLALRAGRPVERDWLAGTLWPDSTESAALAGLRNSLSDLRRALGPGASRLWAPTGRSLCLEVSDTEIDVLAFDTAIAQGDRAALEEAVSLYRGPLLEGCVEEWAFQERQAREQAYLAARERLAALTLERGETAAAERHLRRAVAVDPLHESTQRALMQVLAAGGNYAAALLCYRELRLRLHRELNTAPDAETQTLFQQLRGEARLLAAKGIERQGSGVRGQGSERQGSGDRGQGSETSPEGSVLTPDPYPLTPAKPLPPPSFPELPAAVLRAALARGPGGTGGRARGTGAAARGGAGG